MRITPANCPPMTPGTEAISNTDRPYLRQRTSATTAQTASSTPTTGKSRKMRANALSCLSMSPSIRYITGQVMLFQKSAKKVANTATAPLDDLIRPSAHCRFCSQGSSGCDLASAVSLLVLRQPHTPRARIPNPHKPNAAMKPALNTIISGRKSRNRTASDGLSGFT